MFHNVNMVISFAMNSVAGMLIFVVIMTCFLISVVLVSTNTECVLENWFYLECKWILFKLFRMCSEQDNEKNN